MSAKLPSFKFFSNSQIDEIDPELSENYFTPVLNDVFDSIAPPSAILDVGCGNGLFSAGIKRQIDCRLIGVDGSQYALSHAKRNGFDSTFHINDMCGDTLPIDRESIDLVICKDVLEHLMDPNFVAAEIFRVTKFGGYALVHVPNQFNLIGRLKFLFKNDIDTFNYFEGSERWDYPHIRYFTFDSIIRLFEYNGFTLFLNLSHHFASPARLKNLPLNPLRFLASKNADNFAEGITILFCKRQKK